VDGTALTVAVVNGAFAVTAAMFAARSNMHGKRNTRKLNIIEAQTKRQLDTRIERAVKNVFNQNPEAITGAIVAEALTDLLQQMADLVEDGKQP